MVHFLKEQSTQESPEKIKQVASGIIKACGNLLKVTSFNKAAPQSEDDKKVVSSVQYFYLIMIATKDFSRAFRGLVFFALFYLEASVLSDRNNTATIIIIYLSVYIYHF